MIKDEAYLIIATSKVPEIMGLEDHNVSSYDLYVRKTAESIGCKVLSDRFVKLNGMTSKNCFRDVDHRLRERVSPIHFRLVKALYL